MSVAKKGLFMWWVVGVTMMLLLAISWQFEATRFTVGLRDLSILLGWFAIWSWILVKLSLAHRNNKLDGAAK